MPPWLWPWIRSGFTARPQSSTEAYRTTSTRPVSGSIDLHLAHCGGIGVRRDAHHFVGDRHQRAAQVGRGTVAERASGDLEQADAAVGPLYDEAPECEFDILLGGFEHGAGDAAPLVDDGVCGLGDDPGAKAHRTRRGRAAASLHAVGIAGPQPDPLRLNPEPFRDDLREARLVALARRHCPQYQLDGARRI